MTPGDELLMPERPLLLLRDGLLTKADQEKKRAVQISSAPEFTLTCMDASPESACSLTVSRPQESPSVSRHSRLRTTHMQHARKNGLDTRSPISRVLFPPHLRHEATHTCDCFSAISLLLALMLLNWPPCPDQRGKSRSRQCDPMAGFAPNGHLD